MRTSVTESGIRLCVGYISITKSKYAGNLGPVLVIQLGESGCTAVTPYYHGRQFFQC